MSDEIAGGWWAALGGLVTAVLGGAAAVVVSVWKQKDKSTASSARLATKERRDTIDEWRNYANYLLAQNERKDQAIKDQQEAIESILGDHSECREKIAELRAYVWYLMDALRRAFASLKALGQNPGDIPDMPTDRHGQSDSEFKVRQAEQSANLVSAKDKSAEVKPP